MATIVIFVSSLFIASALIFFKAIELKYGKKNFILNLICRLDAKAEVLVSSLKFRWIQLVQSIRYIALVKTKIICKNLLDRVEARIVDEYRARQSVIMGRRNIMNRGSASFYLRKITENKGIGEKGRIE